MALAWPSFCLLHRYPTSGVRRQSIRARETIPLAGSGSVDHIAITHAPILIAVRSALAMGEVVQRAGRLFLHSAQMRFDRAIAPYKQADSQITGRPRLIAHTLATFVPSECFEQHMALPNSRFTFTPNCLSRHPTCRFV